MLLLLRYTNTQEVKSRTPVFTRVLFWKRIYERK